MVCVCVSFLFHAMTLIHYSAMDRVTDESPTRPWLKKGFVVASRHRRELEEEFELVSFSALPRSSKMLKNPV